MDEKELKTLQTNLKDLELAIKSNMSRNEDITLDIEKHLADIDTIDIMLYYLDTDIDDIFGYVQKLDDSYLQTFVHRIFVLCGKIHDDIISSKKILEKYIWYND